MTPLTSAAERILEEAYNRLAAQVAAEMFRTPEGPAEPPDPWRVRTRRRLRCWWYGVREWIAVYVLRVRVEAER